MDGQPNRVGFSLTQTVSWSILWGNSPPHGLPPCFILCTYKIHQRPNQVRPKF
jgi:hypothetical protein